MSEISNNFVHSGDLVSPERLSELRTAASNNARTRLFAVPALKSEFDALRGAGQIVRILQNLWSNRF